MLWDLKTERGSITLDDAVLGHIIKDEIAATDGRILLATPKGKLWKDSSVIGGNDFFECSRKDGNLEIRVFVIVRMGGSINAALDGLIGGIYQKANDLIGVGVESVAISVKGMISKNISKRDFEVKR